MTSLPIEYRGKRLPMSITGVRFPATYWRAVSQPQAAQLYSGTVSSDLRGRITAFAEDNIDQIDRLVYVTNLSLLTSFCRRSYDRQIQPIFLLKRCFQISLDNTVFEVKINYEIHGLENGIC